MLGGPLSLPYPTAPSPPSLLLEVGPLNPASWYGEHYKLPSGVWGGATAEIKSGAV